MDLQIAVAASMLAASRGRVAAAFKALVPQPDCQPLERILAECGIPSDGWPALVAQAHERAAGALQAAPGLDMQPIPVGDPRYPVLLGCAPDPPPVLWARGDAALLTRPAVAVVGSRAATPYALAVAERLGEELAGRGVVVVSGLARGVDSAAHRGCLSAGGATVAVLGSGLDRIYPPEHRQLAATIGKDGLLLAELGPGAPPMAENFPLRNRIISGISLAVVVVEASEKSGSLITARYALEQGREVMAVPGSVLSGRNRGSHGLLKDGAKVVETADDILEELGWPAAPASPEAIPKSLISDGLLASMAPGEVYALEDLLGETGLPAPRLLARLTELELHGLVRSAGGGRFTRVPGRGGKVRGEVW